MAYWNVSIKKLKGIFMIQPRFQDSVIAWPVLHNLKGTSKSVFFFLFFFCIEYVIIVVAKRSFKLKPRFPATAAT